MLASPETSTGLSLQVIELGLTLVTVALAVCFPRTASGWFSRLESVLGRLARKRALCVFLAGATACTLRLLLLPLSPIPQPDITDDFSFLLAADTFAHGRLTNPTPAMWRHFESFHITLKPTYMSMYFPAQGMVMTAGKILAGHPWWGVWASCGLMCAAICWMLQGWLPPGWALLGGMLTVVRLALFSYWIDTYTGAGALAALGGALVLGAVPRIRRHFRTRDFFWLALGMAILATSRPYEGLLISIPAVSALAWWAYKKSHPAPSILLRRTVPAALVLTATFAFMAYYDHRVFGSAFTPPYKINRQTYAVAQHMLWQSPRPEPVYSHRIIRDFYAGPKGSELRWYRDETSSVSGLVNTSTTKVLAAWAFYLNFALIPPLVMLPWAIRQRRIGPLTVTAIVVVAGLAMETFFVQHYPAPATALLYALLLQCMRHLRVRGPSGLFLVRATPVLCLALAVVRVFAQPLHIDIGRDHWITYSWYGASPVGIDRARILSELENLPGPQLAIVAYAPHHMMNDWVYNAADIDKSKVIWARQMDPASDRELLNYYKGRRAWLVEPDCNPPRISPFPASQESAGLAQMLVPLHSQESE
jgi:hypothetical protein